MILYRVVCLKLTDVQFKVCDFIFGNFRKKCDDRVLTVSQTISDVVEYVSSNIYLTFFQVVPSLVFK